MSFITKSFDDISTQMETEARQRVPLLTNAEGSVARSLFESFSVELATLYMQLDLVYQSGFVDTAQDADLDRVVAILGVKRNEPDYATGVVTFTRDPGTNEEMIIPIGTLVTTEEKEEETPSKKAYVTVETGRAEIGKNSVDVRVQADTVGAGMTSPADTVIVMPRPVPGVKTVTNSEPIRFLGRERETDEELRTRAKQTLLASGRASIPSVENALLGLPGIHSVHVKEDFAEPNPKRGAFEVYVDGLTSQNAAEVRQRIDDVRAAGVYATIKPSVAILVDAILQIDVGNRSTDDQAELENKVRDAVRSYIDRLGMGKPLLMAQLIAAVMKVNGVNDLIKIEITTFGESGENAGTYATGSVTLSRPTKSSGLLTIEADTLLATTLGNEFKTNAEVQFASGKRQVDVAVTAVKQGRAGELYRTGGAVSWKPINVGGIDISISNDSALCIQRTQLQPTGRSILAEPYQRFLSNNIRVASELDKPMRVRVEVRLLDPTPKPAPISKAIDKAVHKFFEGLATQTDRTFTKDKLEAVIAGATPAPGKFELRLVSFPFQGVSPQDDYTIESSFVEKPEVELIFVYTDSLSLSGKLQLVLSLAATPEEKDAAVGATRLALQDYLDGMGPQQDIDLERFETLAAAVDNVLRVEFKTDDCELFDANGVVVDDRIEGSRLKVKAFEKVFLADAPRFVIEA